jgi:hypothetical protein
LEKLFPSFIEVRDESNSELYGFGYICRQFTEEWDDDSVVVDGWIPIVHPIGCVWCSSTIQISALSLCSPPSIVCPSKLAPRRSSWFGDE